VASDRARGLSLWLMAGGQAGKRLSERIERLAMRFGSASFLPHLTLIPGLVVEEVQALRDAARAAAEIEPFVVTLGAPECGEEYFRCLFLRAQDDRALRTAHATAARAFGREPDPGFLPHVSLVYGTLASEEKRVVVQELGDSLCLSFQALRLQLWRTEGSVAEWRNLATFAIGRQCRPGSPAE
jgi:2'-5' RNA ligase